MNMQELFSVGSQVSFAGACVLFVVTVRYAVVHDVRGVMDDLSGRKRQRGIEDTYERVRAASSSEVRKPVDGTSDDMALTVGSSFETHEKTLIEQEEALVEQAETLADAPVMACATNESAASSTRTFRFEITREIVLCGLGAKESEGGATL